MDNILSKNILSLKEKKFKVVLENTKNINSARINREWQATAVTKEGGTLSSILVVTAISYQLPFIITYN